MNPNERRAVAAMYVGLGLTLVAAAVPYTTQLLADHVRAGYPAYTQERIDAAVTTYLVLLSVVGALGVAAWLWTTWAVRTGRRWARPAVTVMSVLGVSVGLVGLLTRDTSGDTGLPPVLGWAGMAPWLAALLAVTLLWRNPRPMSR
ncbi:hypothetical protein [Streptosporangium saharense]|uniref:hypothetical protein n=1 Tax=Streptosporangium saharense TaxID=1706840 RepID=UPI0036A3A28D